MRYDARNGYSDCAAVCGDASYRLATLFPYDSAATWKAVIRLPATSFGAGRVTGKTRTEIGIARWAPSATTVTWPGYVPGAVPDGTPTCSHIGWFGSSVARDVPSQGRSASGTDEPPTET